MSSTNCNKQTGCSILKPNKKRHEQTRGRWRQPSNKSAASPPLNYLKMVVLCLCHLVIWVSLVAAQLPNDMERELNQNLAEQARLQAIRARHQQQIAARHGAVTARPAATQKPAIDPNNYSFQQVSPPIQYSYYQPYGDLAPKDPSKVSGLERQQPQARAGQAAAPTPQINIDLNNLNIDIPNLPTPQAQTAGQSAAAPHYRAQRRQFNGAGALGVPQMQPVAAAQQAPDSFAPLQPQAQTSAGAGQPQIQQGPPLTEADFKDITGGENYGAPQGSDFGTPASAGGGGADNPDPASEPRAGQDEFGMPQGAGQVDQDQGQDQQAAPKQRQDNSMGGMLPDFGNFNPMGAAVMSQQQQPIRRGGGSGFDPFSAAGMGGGLPFGNEIGNIGSAMGGQTPRRQSRPAGDFDFASQPSSQGDATASQPGGRSGAPGSLQSLLGGSFPGLSSGPVGNMGLDMLTRGTGGGEDPASQSRSGGGDDVGGLDLADMGVDFDGSQQPAQGEQDFNLAAAAAEQQPKTVLYPDGSPQFVGTVWALSQPQSMTQTRYNVLPDHGTYQDYPAYQSGGNDFGAVRGVVDGTPRARDAGPGRYSNPSPQELAPEHRPELASSQVQYDYARGPFGSRPGGGGDGESSSLSRDFDDDDDFVD